MVPQSKWACSELTSWLYNPTAHHKYHFISWAEGRIWPNRPWFSQDQGTIRIHNCQLKFRQFCQDSWDFFRALRVLRVDSSGIHRGVQHIAILSTSTLAQWSKRKKLKLKHGKHRQFLAVSVTSQFVISQWNVQASCNTDLSSPKLLGLSGRHWGIPKKRHHLVYLCNISWLLLTVITCRINCHTLG